MQPTTQLCDILVVEDDEPIRTVLAESLRDEGYQVATAAHGRAALDYLQQADALPHLILLDVMMPVMDGPAFRAALKLDLAWRDIPVVVLSAVANRLNAREVAALDAVAYVPKPFEWADLYDVINEWCPP